VFYNILMGKLPVVRIPLKDISKDISSKLNNGTQEVLFLRSNDGEFEKVMKDVMSEGNLWFKLRVYFGRKIKVMCDEEAFLAYKIESTYKNTRNQRYNTQINNSHQSPKIYKINLRGIELV